MLRSACFPTRPAPMPFGGSSSLTAHHSLKHPPVRPQRLRIYHPGQTTMWCGESTHGRDLRDTLHRARYERLISRFAPGNSLRPAQPLLLRPSAPLLTAPADPGSASLPASRAALSLGRSLALPLTLGVRASRRAGPLSRARTPGHPAIAEAVPSSSTWRYRDDPILPSSIESRT